MPTKFDRNLGYSAIAVSDGAVLDSLDSGLARLKHALRKAFAPPVEKDNVLTNPTVAIAIVAVVIPLIFLFFRPTIVQILQLYAIDLASFTFFRIIDFRIYYKFFPDSRYFFPKVSPSLKEIITLEERKKVFYAIHRFPRQRTTYFFLVSLIKVLPAVIFMLVTWGTKEHYLYTLLKTLCVLGFTFTFAISMSFLAYHKVMDDTLAEIHDRYNWSKVFSDVKVKFDTSTWNMAEKLSSLSLGILACGLIGFIIADRTSDLRFSLLQFGFVVLSSGFLFYKVLDTSRFQIQDGIEKVVSRIVKDREKSITTAPSSNAQVAAYQSAISTLVQEAEAAEQKAIRTKYEKDALLKRALEEDRYKDIGRVTTHFLHDAANLMSAIRLWATMNLDNASAGLKGIATDSARNSALKLVDLLEHLRKSVRHSGKVPGIASVSEAFAEAIKYENLLEQEKGIKYEDNIENPLVIGLSEPFIRQIFWNLISNSTSNFREAQVSDATIKISFIRESERHAFIEYVDNGTGFSVEQFEELTTRSAFDSKSEGIGLRIIREMLQLDGGDLTVAPSVDSVGAGTRYILMLPKPRSFNNEI